MQKLLLADEGVIINGVHWATRNVAAPGTFADKPEDTGMFYQWNRKKAWSAEGDTVENWDSSMPEGMEWKKANDLSPSGWRVPTHEEIESLLNTAKVNSEWITQNEVTGYKFTDKATGNSIFLPASCFRYLEDGVRTAGIGAVHRTMRTACFSGANTQTLAPATAITAFQSAAWQNETTFIVITGLTCKPHPNPPL